MRLHRLDSIPLDQTYYTEEGYLVDHPIVTACGIFEYQNADGSTRRELRLPEEVFDKKSLQSYKGKPIIITHEAREVDKGNVRREQIGTIMSEGYQDGEHVRCEIIIHDTNALKQCGLKELSLGYSLDTEESPGVWKGEKYDCIQRNIEINHLAVVGTARAGGTARLNIDSKDDDTYFLRGGRIAMEEKNATGSRADNDLSPEELDAAIALFKAQKAAERASGGSTDGADPKTTLAAGEDFEKEKSPVEKVRANMEHRDAEGKDMPPENVIAEQMEDIRTLLEEIDRLQASNDMEAAGGGKENTDSGEKETESSEEPEKQEKGMNLDSLDQILKDRLDICRMADKLSLDGVEVLSIMEGRKKIIKAVNPKMNLDGKSESYINAAYDIAKDTFNSRRNTDEQRRQMTDSQIRRDAKEECSSSTARKSMISRLTGGKE